MTRAPNQVRTSHSHRQLTLIIIMTTRSTRHQHTKLNTGRPHLNNNRRHNIRSLFSIISLPRIRSIRSNPAHNTRIRRLPHQRPQPQHSRSLNNTSQIVPQLTMTRTMRTSRFNSRKRIRPNNSIHTNTRTANLNSLRPNSTTMLRRNLSQISLILMTRQLPKNSSTNTHTQSPHRRTRHNSTHRHNTNNVTTSIIIRTRLTLNQRRHTSQVHTTTSTISSFLNRFRMSKLTSFTRN